MMMSSSRGLSQLFSRVRDTATWHRLGDTTLVLNVHEKTHPCEQRFEKKGATQTDAENLVNWRQH